MDYRPSTIDTTAVSLPEGLDELVERLAENVHDHWALRRMADGWTHGPHRDDGRKEHPMLVPYGMLPESEKAYDRVLVENTLKAVVALGYRIEKGGGPPKKSRRTHE